MNKLSKFVVGLATSAFTMTGCGSSWKKVSFETFKEKALSAIEAGKEMAFDRISVLFDNKKVEISGLLGDKADYVMEINGKKAETEEEIFECLDYVGFIKFATLELEIEEEYQDSYYVDGKNFKCVSNLNEEGLFVTKEVMIYNEYGWLSEMSGKGKTKNPETNEWEEINTVLQITYYDIQKMIVY